MELEPYLERYKEESALTRLRSVLEFSSDADAYEAWRVLTDFLEHPGYPGVALERSGRCFEIDLAAYGRDGHLDYLDRLMTTLSSLSPQVIQALPKT